MELDSICKSKLENLQEVMKIYLMATNGSTERLGIAACALVDILDKLCHLHYEEASRQLDDVSLSLIKIIYISVIERMERLDNPPAFAWQTTQKRIELETELLPHAEFLKSTLTDLGIVTKTSHAAILQKLGELIYALRS